MGFEDISLINKDSVKYETSKVKHDAPRIFQRI